MVIALLLGLGLLLSAAPGPGCLVCHHAGAPPDTISSGTFPLLQTVPPRGCPSPASREEAGLSEPERKEEEPVHSLVLGLPRTCDRTGPVRLRNPASSWHGAARGLLHQLHHSWQLVC